MDKIEITPELLADIKAKAEKATPGPWEYREDNAAGYNIESQNDYIVYSGTDSDCECDYGCEKESNAAYIAAANPAVILDLIEDYGGKQQALYGIFLLVDQLKDCLNLEADVSVEGTIQGAIIQINHDDTAKKFEIERLEKEANWLAKQLSRQCQADDEIECGKSCEFVEGGCCNKGEYFECYDVIADDWREAARKAVEMSGHEKN